MIIKISHKEYEAIKNNAEYFQHKFDVENDELFIDGTRFMLSYNKDADLYHALVITTDSDLELKAVKKFTIFKNQALNNKQKEL